MGKRVGRFFIALLQRVVFSFEQFGRHEMANHAAGGAYAFLLSAMPALLIIVYISSRIYGAMDMDASSVAVFLEPYLGDFGAGEVTRVFLDKPVTGLAGLFGAVNLIWAARLFVVSIQRGLRVIYRDTAATSALRENLLTFAVELVLMFAVVVLISGVQILRALVDLLQWQAAREFFGGLSLAVLKLLPYLALWLFVYLTYRSIPKYKPKNRYALLAATACVLAYALFGAFLGLFLNTARYGLLYGIFGNLISGLLKVFAFFWLYFFCAELMYASEFFDVMLFSRFSRLATTHGKTNRIESFLFANPARLFRRFACSYEKGDIIFRRGDKDNRVLYLHQGRVAIYLDDPEAVPDAAPASGLAGAPAGGSAGQHPPRQPVAEMAAGAFFGEMAALLEEERSGWAVATEDSLVFVLPAGMFERYLASAPTESRKLIHLLAERLKANNERLRQDGRYSGGGV